MKNRIITISREFGSGGRTIGKRTAEALGIPCYDRELIQKLAAKSGFSEVYIEDTGESAPGGFLASAFSHRYGEPNNADYLWKVQYQVITELAKQGPCVIVGRCADYILQDKADCLRVFIHADMKFRARRIAEFFPRHMSPGKTDLILFRHLRMTELCEALAQNWEHFYFFDKLKGPKAYGFGAFLLWEDHI